MGSNQFCLRWNNHQNNLLTVFDDLLNTESFVDVTLACDGMALKAHKVVLSACSSFFQELFKDNPCQHPIVILKDVRYSDLKAIIKFMYKGEVNISQEQLPPLLKAADALRVKGLVEITQDQQEQVLGGNSKEPSPNQEIMPPDRQPPVASDTFIMTPQLIPMIFQPTQPQLKKQGKIFERKLCPTSSSVVVPTSTVDQVQSVTMGLKSPNQPQTSPANLPSSPTPKTSEPMLISQVPDVHIKGEIMESPNSNNGENGNETEYSANDNYPIFPESDMNNSHQTYRLNISTDLIHASSRDGDLISGDALDHVNTASTSVIQGEQRGPGERVRTRTFKTKQWNDKDLVKALKLVKHDKWDIRSSAESFNIPYHTLYYHLRMSSNFKKNKDKLYKFSDQVLEKVIE